MRPFRVLLAVGAAVVVSGCGAQEAEVVKTAFEKDIKSANVAVAFSAESSQGGMRLSLDGPYQSNGDGELPSANLAVRVEGAAPGTIEGRLISTGSNAFVQYGGETYEVGEDKVAELKRQGASSPDQLTPADVKALLGQMQDWFPESDAQEDADLGGEPVTRVTGKLDLSKALEDLKGLAQRPGISGAEGLKQLSNGDIKRIERMFSDPRFTIDVGKSDGKLRRIVAGLKLDDGSQSSTMEFSMRFSDVDEPVQIDAPAAGSGRPIEELGQALQRDFGGNADEQIS